MMRKNEVGVNDEAASLVELVILAFQGGSGVPQIINKGINFEATKQLSKVCIN